MRYPQSAAIHRLTGRPVKKTFTPNKGRLPVPAGFSDNIRRYGVTRCAEFYDVSNSTISMWMDDEGINDTGYVGKTTKRCS